MLCIISYKSASSDTYRKPSTTMHHRVTREAISFQLLEISALLISRQTNIISRSHSRTHTHNTSLCYAQYMNLQYSMNYTL